MTIAAEPASGYVTRIISRPDHQQRASINQFHDSIPNVHFKQRLNWFDSHNGQHELLYVVTWHGTDICAASLVRAISVPLLSAFKRYVIFRGPVWIDLAALSVHVGQLITMLESAAVWIRLLPYCENDGEVAARLAAAGLMADSSAFAYTRTGRIDLRRSEHEIWDGISSAHRRQIRKAEKSDIDIRDVTTQDEADHFIAHYSMFAADKGIAPIDDSDRKYITSIIQDRQGRLSMMLAYRDGELLSGVAALACGQTLVFEWGFSTEAGWSSGLPLSHLLQWKTMLWARGHGYLSYDLGGLSSGPVDHNINQFKTGFGCEVYDLTRQQVRVCSPLLDRVLRMLAKLRSIMVKTGRGFGR
ncbi:MAG: GNAT family N-acetyltransferase [Gammaproteobacteria bacterium]|nr:GNAT family N-acetyltransferase [Gammaproteobacteria bacterium]